MEASLTSDEPLVVDETSEECREGGSRGRLERFYTGLEQRRTRIVLDRPDLTLMAVALKAVDTIEAGPLQVFIADPSGDADELSAPLLFSTKSTRTAGGFLIAN